MFFFFFYYELKTKSFNSIHSFVFVCFLIFIFYFLHEKIISVSLHAFNDSIYIQYLFQITFWIVLFCVLFYFTQKEQKRKRNKNILFLLLCIYYSHEFTIYSIHWNYSPFGFDFVFCFVVLIFVCWKCELKRYFLFGFSLFLYFSFKNGHFMRIIFFFFS